MVTNTTTVDRYIVSGSSYAISFPYWKEEEIKAVITKSDGSLQDLVLNTDYSVSTPNGNNGTLTKITAWTGAAKLTIYRESAKTQEVDLVQGQKINADTIENAFDHAIAINQELQEKLSRSITTSIDEAGSDIQLPNKTTRAGMLLGFDDSGDNAALRSLAQFDLDVASAASNASIASSAAASAGASDLKAEGYAVGEQGGVPVTGGTYYHNNAKHYKEQADISAGQAASMKNQAAASALVSEGWAKGTQGGVAVDNTSPYYQANSKYYKEQAAGSATAAAASEVQTGLDKTAAGNSAAEAKDWANKAEDSVVKDGEYSAKHYAAKASASASSASTSATAADNARIASVLETISPDDGGENVITITYKDGTTKTFSVYNGHQGTIIYPVFDVDAATGKLVMYSDDDYEGIMFRLKADGHLESYRETA